MTEAATKDHGLNEFVGFASGDQAGIEMTIRSDLGSVNLRGDADNPSFIGAAEKVLGQSLPVTANAISSGPREIFWLGPNEWLVLATETEAGSLATTLADALDGMHAAVNVVSGGQIAMTLSGDRVRELLSKGCTIDFHPREFREGMCVQSGLAKASVVIGMPGKDDRFIVIVRRSFSDYLLHWLTDAAAEYGVRVEAT